jgi:site-specific DNA recombinase
MALLVSYARVSSDSQRDNTSLEHQYKRIEAYCTSAGHEMIAHCWDTETATGKKQRPGFIQALMLVYAGQADGIICMKLDRFARNTLDGLQVVADLNRAQKQLVVLDLNLDTTTPMGKCVLSVLFSFAQLERDMINERTSAGRAAVIKSGGYAFGHPPYGWRAEGKRLVIDPFQQEIRALVFDLRAQGCTFKQIAEELNKRQVPAKRGGQWYKTTIRTMLTSERFGNAHVMEEKDDCSGHGQRSSA